MNYKNFVFEGGGVKGIAYCGALIKLQKLGVLNDVRRTAGASAGAITATLLALRKSPVEIYDVMRSLDFNDFADDSFGIVRDLRRFLQDYGYHKGDNFSHWIADQIRHTTGSASTTFKQLKDMEFFADPYLVVTNLTLQQPEIFSWETTPNVPVAVAVRMSMSIPLYYKACWHNDCIMVDGGVSMNYPIHMFDTANEVNEATLGLRLDTSKEIEINKNKWQSTPKKVTNIVEYTTALLDFMIERANHSHLKESDKKRTIFIDSLDVRTTDFDLTQIKVDQLVASGMMAVDEFFK